MSAALRLRLRSPGRLATIEHMFDSWDGVANEVTALVAGFDPDAIPADAVIPLH